MGCLSSKEEVNTAKYAVGAGSGSSMSREAADAVALVTGTNAYSSWVEIQVGRFCMWDLFGWNIFVWPSAIIGTCCVGAQPAGWKFRCPARI